MPLYEFVCKNCDNRFTTLCDINTTEVKCECGEMAKKVISASNWVFNTSCTNPIPPKDNIQDKVNGNRESRILFDFTCDKCGISDERFIYLSDVENQYCDKCGTKLSLNTLCTNFELKYDPKKDICNWHGETSMYWSKVKEERRKGKQVKGLGEK